MQTLEHNTSASTAFQQSFVALLKAEQPATHSGAKPGAPEYTGMADLSVANELPFHDPDTGALIVNRQATNLEIKCYQSNKFWGTPVRCYNLDGFGMGVRPTEAQACLAVGLGPHTVRDARRHPNGKTAKLLRSHGYDHTSLVTVIDGSTRNNCITPENWVALYKVAVELGTDRSKAITQANFEGTLAMKLGRMLGHSIDVDEALTFLNLRVSMVEDNLEYKRAIGHNKNLMLRLIGDDKALFEDPALRKEFTAMPAIGTGEIYKCLFGMTKREILLALDVAGAEDIKLREMISPRDYLCADDCHRIRTLEQAVARKLLKAEKYVDDMQGFVQSIHQQLVAIDDDYAPRPPKRGGKTCTLQDVAHYRRFERKRLSRSGK